MHIILFFGVLGSWVNFLLSSTDALLLWAYLLPLIWIYLIRGPLPPVLILSALRSTTDSL